MAWRRGIQSLGNLSARSLAVVAGLGVVCGCSDAATRVAYDIESGTGRLQSDEGARADISHVPRSWPEGCSGSYTLRIEKGAAVHDGQGNFRTAENSGGLSVRCYGQDGNAHRWHTTYHLRFVDVPATVEVTKNGGQTAIIQIQRLSGKANVIGLH
jgi:hypothetical protein